MEGSSSDQFSDEAPKHGYGPGNEVMYLTRQRAQSPPLARHALASSEAVEQIKVGSFYEIDHSKLPPKTPEQLYSIRVAMVSEKAGSKASLRFPSVHSLRNHFSDGNYGKPEGKELPALDEKYVMGSVVAAEVLLRRIPCQEIAEDGNLWSFWASPALAADRNGLEDVISKKGSCWSELNFPGMVRWGKRRKIRFLNRHHEYKLGVLASTANDNDDDKEAKKEEEEDQEEKAEEVEEKDWEEKEEDQEEKEEGVAEGVKEGQVKVGADEFGVKNRRSSKRKRPGKNSKTENLKRAKTDQKQNKKLLSRSTKKPFRNFIERWSTARYKLAEENMLKIMKAKGAVLGNPILRPALRTEARKLIGDTGLLDHLLKHMAGKVAPGGTDRFRRRHNSDGAMEYWIESADLVNIREQAGVQDPYWTPPPGWKPGDNPTQDPVCAREIKALKQEIVNIKKMIQEVLKKQDEEHVSTRELKHLREEMVKMKKNREELASKKPMEASQNSNSCVQFDHEGSLLLMKKMHMELMNRKANVEEQLMEISDCLIEMEDHIRMLKSRKLTLSESEAPPTLLMESTTSPSDSERSARAEKGSQKNKLISKSHDQGGDNPASTVTEDKATRIQRMKSGFRICKPQGTFLWPNMATLTQPAVHPDDLGPLVVPTAPSISSSTTSTQPHQLFQERQSPQCGPKPPSPVKPLAAKRPVRSATLRTVSKGSSSSSSSIPPPPTAPNSQTMITIKTSTSLINLNETPNDQNNDDGFFGSLTHQRQQSTVTNIAAITSLVLTGKERERAEDKENGMNDNEFEQQHQRECSSTCTSRVPQIMEEDRWLGLAAQDPAVNCKRG